MKTWLGVCCVLAAVGCTRDNPAFETETSDGESSPETTIESSSSGSEDPLPTCGLERGPDGIIEVPFPCESNNGAYDKWFRISLVNDERSLDACEAECADCGKDVPHTFVIPGVEPQWLGPLDTCLHIRALQPSDPDDVCEYHSIVIETGEVNAPEPLVVARVRELIGMPMVTGALELNGFNPKLEPGDWCACEDSPNLCCGNDEVAVQQFEFDIGTDDWVEVGGEGEVTLDGELYDFLGVEAEQLGCGTPRELAWTLSRDAP